MRAALGFSAQGARSLGCAQGVVPSPPFPGGAERPFHPHSPPLLPQPPTRDGAVCGVESPRWERYCDAAFPGRSANPWGCGDGGEREGVHPRGGCPGGRSPGRGAWEERPLPPWRHGPVFRRPAPSPAKAELSPSSKSQKLLQARRRLGRGGGGGRAPFAGSTPLRAEDKALEHSGSSTRAQCARRASLGQERHGIPARTGLGEEAELCALESESPARSGSETTCSCSYLPAPPRKQQCFWRARARVCVCVCGT